MSSDLTKNLELTTKENSALTPIDDLDPSFKMDLYATFKQKIHSLGKDLGIGNIDNILKNKEIDDKDFDTLFIRLAAETGIDKRTLIKYHYNGSTNAKGYEKLLSTFSRVRTRYANSENLFKAAIDSTQPGLNLTYGYANSDYASSKDKIENAIDIVEGLWQKRSQFTERKKTQKEKIKSIGKFNTLVIEAYKSLIDTKTLVFLGPIPKYLQPPVEMGFKGFFRGYLVCVICCPDQHSNEMVLKMQELPLDIDWTNTFFYKI